MARPRAAADEPKGPPVISKKKLGDLLKDARAISADIKEQAGTLGQQVKEAVENNHLHRKAFTAVRGLDKMEPEKLAEFFYHFDRYLDMTGLRERAATAPNFWEGHDGEVEDDENVTRFPAAAE